MKERVLEQLIRETLLDNMGSPEAAERLGRPASFASYALFFRPTR
jgi:hypothetical protein